MEELATQAFCEEITLSAFQIHKIKALFEANQFNQSDAEPTSQDDYFNKLRWTKKLETEIEWYDKYGLKSILTN